MPPPKTTKEDETTFIAFLEAVTEIQIFLSNMAAKVPSPQANGLNNGSTERSPSMSHQNSGGSGSVGSANNRLSPNISVNIVHHLHPNVSHLFTLLIGLLLGDFKTLCRTENTVGL